MRSALYVRLLLTSVTSVLGGRTLHAQSAAVPVAATYIAGPASSTPASLALGNPPLRVVTSSREVEPWRGVEARRRPSRRWPLYVLGGAAVGYVALTSYALRGCDAGCRDDGGEGWAYTLWGGMGAAGGAVAGLVVGLVSDHARGAFGR